MKCYYLFITTEWYSGTKKSSNQFQWCTSLLEAGLLLWGVWRPSMAE